MSAETRLASLQKLRGHYVRYFNPIFVRQQVVNLSGAHPASYPVGNVRSYPGGEAAEE